MDDVVLPIEEEEIVKKEVDVQSTVQSLVGVIPCIDMTLSEIREERLMKFEVLLEGKDGLKNEGSGAVGYA